MKNNFKKVSSAVMAAAMIISAAPLSQTLKLESVVPTSFSASALDETQNADISWVYDDNTCTLTFSGTGAMPDYADPKDSPFAGDSSISNVVIGEGITSIGANTFAGCVFLSTVSLPRTMREVHDNALKGCPIRELSLYLIDDDFGIEFYDDFDIDDNALDITAVENLTDTVYYEWNEKTGEVVIKGTGVIPAYDSKVGSPFVKKEGIRKIVIDDGITEIGMDAFALCKDLEYVEIGDSVKTIGDGAFFYNEKLLSVDLGNSVETIGIGAFTLCPNAQFSEIPQSVKFIGESAFAYTSIENVNISKDTEIGKTAFALCTNLSSINVDSENEKYTSRDGVLYSKDMSTLITYPSGREYPEFVMPTEVKTVEESAFACEYLTDIYYKGTEEQWNSIEIRRNNEQLTTDYVTLHLNWNPAENAGDINWNFDETTGTLTFSGTGAMIDYADAEDSPFAGDMSIRSVVIGEGITSIGTNTFAGCENLSSVSLPRTMEMIRHNALKDCNNIKDLYMFENNVDEIYVEFYDDIDIDDESVHVTVMGKLTDTVYYEGNAKTGEVVIKGTGAIPAYDSKAGSPFVLEKGIRKIVIEDGITEIGLDAFALCKDLEEVEIGNGVKVIGDGAFFFGEKLASVKFGGSVETIGVGAFIGCPNAKFSEIPQSVKFIGEGAFLDTSIENVNIPKDTEIGRAAFAACPYLESITVDAENKNYSSKDGVLYNKDKTQLVQYCCGSDAKSFTVPDGVKVISELAFCGSVNLEELIISGSVVSVENNSVEECPNLRVIYIESDILETVSNTFGSLSDSAFFVVRAGSQTEEAVKTAGYDYVTFSIREEDGKQVAAFGGTTVIEENADFGYLSRIVGTNPGTDYFYFDTLELMGADAKNIPAALSANVTSADGSVVMNNVYVAVKKDGKAVGFDTLRKAAENGTLSSLVSTSVPEEVQQKEEEKSENILEVIFQAIENFFKNIIERLLNIKK